VRILAEVRKLWGDFGRAIHAHRSATHFTILIEQALFVGQLQGKLKLLQARLDMMPAGQREGLINYLNRIDGEAALCRDLADRRDLGLRINLHAGIPLMDGLTLRALTYVFGEHADVWTDFKALVEASVALKGVGVRRMHP
jgi:hypothetical protein